MPSDTNGRVIPYDEYTIFMSPSGTEEFGLGYNKALKEIEAAEQERQEGCEYLPRHASTGLNSFVTRLEEGRLKERRGGMCSVSSRDLHGILYHFIRLDNELRTNPPIEDK
jgi:hypothetical protein